MSKGATCADCGERLDYRAGVAPPDPYEQCVHCGTWHYCQCARKCSHAEGHDYSSARWMR